jgi:replicative DNA helicase
LLGAILLDTAKATEFLDGLEPTDFFLPFHQVVFRHMKRLRSLGMPTNDLVLLIDAIAESNETEAAGGADFIASLTDGRARVSNCAYYADIVRTNAQGRAAIYLCQSNIDRLLGANGNLAAVLEDISNHSASIYVKFGQKEPDPYRTAADVAEATPAIELLVEPYLVKGAVTAAA